MFWFTWFRQDYWKLLLKAISLSLSLYPIPISTHIHKIKLVQHTQAMIIPNWRAIYHCRGANVFFLIDFWSVGYRAAETDVVAHSGLSRDSSAIIWNIPCTCALSSPVTERSCVTKPCRKPLSPNCKGALCHSQVNRECPLKFQLILNCPCRYYISCVV